jgi:hypothetical protein
MIYRRENLSFTGLFLKYVKRSIQFDLTALLQCCAIIHDKLHL